MILPKPFMGYSKSSPDFPRGPNIL
jgi:hypothetical protein